MINYYKFLHSFHIFVEKFCQILKLFLDAPDYTVTDEDIIKFIWKGQSNVQINTFCSAGNKLGKRLE